MKVTEDETKESTKRPCGSGWPQRDSAEHEEYKERAQVCPLCGRHGHLLQGQGERKANAGTHHLESTDEWMRRRIRMVFWKKWKRVGTKYRNLRKLGLDHNDAYMKTVHPAGGAAHGPSRLE